MKFIQQNIIFPDDVIKYCKLQEFSLSTKIIGFSMTCIYVKNNNTQSFSCNANNIEEYNRRIRAMKSYVYGL